MLSGDTAMVDLPGARRRTLSPPTVTGQFTGHRGEFYDQDDFNGRKILVRYVSLDISPKSARMEQSWSDDGGKTWN